jgi:hypothetical protein
MDRIGPLVRSVVFYCPMIVSVSVPYTTHDDRIALQDHQKGKQEERRSISFSPFGGS